MAKPKNPNHRDYTLEEDAWLLRRVAPSGRKPWIKIAEEFNASELSDGRAHPNFKKVNKDQVRGRWRQLVDAKGDDAVYDPDRYLDAMREVDLEGDVILEKLVFPKFPDLKVPEFDWKAWYEAAELLAKLTNEMDPTITSTRIHIPTDKPIALMNVGDWHLGSRFVAYKTFRALLDVTLATERVYWANYGDESDNFPMDWLPPAIQQVITPRSQRLLVNAITQQLIDKGKMLWSFWSNHHGFTERRIGEDLLAPVFQDNIPFFHGKGVVKLKIGANEATAEEYVIYGSHEFKGSSMYNINHPQMRALLWEVPSADFVIMGDKHKYGYTEVSHHDNAFYAGLHKNHIAHLLQIGTAKTGPDHYTIRGWSAGMFEWPCFILYPDRHVIKRAYDFADLEHFLDVKIDPKLLAKLDEAAEEEGVKHS